MCNCNTRGDQAAEQRLRGYFFSEELWQLLPERARSSLVNADRDWFGGSSSRTEALLNEFKVAVEEILFRGLWQRPDKWITSQGDRRGDVFEFTKLKTELADKGFTPDLFHYEQVCRMTATGAFLKQKGIAGIERQWFAEELPKSLSRLRDARRHAEHESDNLWTRPQLKEYVDEFLGIGQQGTILRLAKVLFGQQTH